LPTEFTKETLHIPESGKLVILQPDTDDDEEEYGSWFATPPETLCTYKQSPDRRTLSSSRRAFDMYFQTGSNG
jgi:hypothetical protein